MEDKSSPNKIKIQKQIYFHRKDSQLKWKDIKHLQLEDDDIIRASWVEDDNFDYHGYWHGEITRMVEETDVEFEKRIEHNKRIAKDMKQRRYENYLKLKKEFENESEG